MRPSIPGWRKDVNWVVIAAVLCAAYAACFGRLTSLPMQDYPNHVARAVVMADLLFHQGSSFGQYFQVHLAAMPYVLPDLVLMGLVEVFGLSVGTALFTSLVLLSLPCALYFYAGVKNFSARARLFVFMLGLYLSTDWFFLSGFMAFRLALALTIVSLAIAETLRRRWSVRVFAAHILVLVLGYLTHLTAPVFVAIALSVSALVRFWFGTATVRSESYLLAPLVMVFVWHFGVAAESHASGASVGFTWAPPGGGRAVVRKIRDLSFEFTDFNWRLARPTLILFAACLCLPAGLGFNKSAFRNPAAVEAVVLAAAFLAVYFVLPFNYGGEEMMYLDVRALPMIPLLLLFAWVPSLSLASVQKTAASALALALATVLALGNLAYLTVSLNHADVWINNYRALEAWIPRHSYVLPVHTETKQPHLLHVGSHVVLDRGAVAPYLFNGDDGHPQQYFRYRDKPYAPHPQWYRRHLHGGAAPSGSTDFSVDWNRVACTYDFLLVTNPFDAHMIGVRTITVAANASGTLLAVDEQACLVPEKNRRRR
jgi:hypothetical protein